MTLLTNTLGMLFAKVETNSNLIEIVGEGLVHQKTSQINSVITEFVNNHSGLVSRKLRGGLLCGFPNADSAAVAAIEIQESNNKMSFFSTIAADYDPSIFKELTLPITIALNYGQMEVVSGTIGGDGINEVIELIDNVEEGQVLATNKLTNALTDNVKLYLSERDTLKTNKNAQELQVYKLSKIKTED
mgnify:FL=1